MSLDHRLEALVGQWSGSNTLYLPWLPNPEHVSETTLGVVPVAGKAGLALTQAWTHDTVGQEGVILIGFQPPTHLTGAWLDSWHMHEKLMQLSGSLTDERLELRGEYEVPDHPNWHWRITIRQPMLHELHLTMHNITPAGDEQLAVDSKYTNATPGV